MYEIVQRLHPVKIPSTLGEIIFLAIVLDLFIIIPLLVILIHVLRRILDRHYDPLLFKTPYFTANEIAIFSSWPLSLIKTSFYIVFLAFPLYGGTRFRSSKNIPAARKSWKILSTIYCIFVAIGFVILFIGIIFNAFI